MGSPLCTVRYCEIEIECLTLFTAADVIKMLLTRKVDRKLLGNIKYPKTVFCLTVIIIVEVTHRTIFAH
jgi:hypothetical protein